MPTKSEAIKRFLTDFTKSDLAALYDYSMEVQVNVAQDGGQPIQGKAGFTGRLWRGYSDGEQTWKSFRIPWNAATKPEYSETDIKGKSKHLSFDLSVHAEGIGMTGWCWEQGVSKWVAFDFDSITGHSENHTAKLTAEELQEVQEAACSIPWVTVRKSTAGQGLHLYVFLDNVPTATHTEHAALGRSILGKMSAAVGFDFTSKVDACGGVMWFWHRKLKGTDGLALIKQGSVLIDIPINWKDHLTVIKGKRRKNLPSYIKESEQDDFDLLTGQRAKVKLDKEHQKLLKFLEDSKAGYWWDQDHHLAVTHTTDLAKAHEELGLRGLFQTISTGKDQGDHNIFLTPKEQPAGAWTVRRFTPGVAEAPTWTQDASGWTICAYNQDPTLSTAARAHDGIEDEKGGFYFNEAEVASTALQSLGTHVDIPTWAYNRDTVIKQHRDGRRLIVKIKREPTDRYDDLRGWREDKGWWTRIFDAKLSQPDTTEPQNFDNLIRHLITVSGDDYGWVIRSSNKWHTEPLGHVKIALKSLELSEKEVNKALGNCIMEGWTIVNEPFQPEFPGDRKWNRDAAQMRYPPQQKEPFIHLTWDKILDHCGLGLDSAIKEDGWCQANGIDNGGDYLRVWVASLFQEPTKPLPYLFFYSKEEQTGKSTFHDALRLLITPKGYTKANAALINPQAFNEEMENAVLCAIEECDLRKGAQARNRIKDWVTSPTLLIHPKGRTPYLVTNTSHFVQTANDPGECPIIPGDTRITVGYVPPLDPLEMVPRDVLFQLLSKEAPAFMATLLKLEIPKCTDRLNIPVINTEEKALSASFNRSDLEIFIDELTFDDPGGSVSYKEVWNRFQEWLDPNTVHLWSKIRMGRELPAKYPKGRLMSEGAQFYVGNLSFTKPSTAIKRLRLVLRKDSLIPKDS